MNDRQNNRNRRRKQSDNGKLSQPKPLPPSRRRKGTPNIPPIEIGIEPLPKR